MSSQNTAHTIGFEDGEMPCQAQIKRAEILNKGSHGQAINTQSYDDQNYSYTSQATNTQSSDDQNYSYTSKATNTQSSDDQNSSYTSQATNFLQQTGEQVKHIAQEAADVVKNTLGMNKTDNTSNTPSPTATASATFTSTANANATSTNHPSNPFPRT